jgi:hypothetical protein
MSAPPTSAVVDVMADDGREVVWIPPSPIFAAVILASSVRVIDFRPQSPEEVGRKFRVVEDFRGQIALREEAMACSL